MKLPSSLIFLLALVAASSTNAHPSFVVSHRAKTTLPPSTTAKALSVRGGASIDKDAVATYAETFIGIYSGLSALAPKKVASLYKIQSTPILDFIGVNDATCTYMGSIMWFLLAKKDMSVPKAIAIGCAPLFLRSLQSLLNDKPKEYNYSSVADYVNLAIPSVIAFGAWKDTSWADLPCKVMAGWALLNGILLFFTPEFFGKVYGTPKYETVHYAYRRMYGLDLCSLALFLWLVLLEVDTNQALGYAWLAEMAGMASMTFITKDFPNVGCDYASLVPWVVLCGLVSGALLLPGGETTVTSDATV